MWVTLWGQDFGRRHARTQEQSEVGFAGSAKLTVMRFANGHGVRAPRQNFNFVSIDAFR